MANLSSRSAGRYRGLPLRPGNGGGRGGPELLRPSAAGAGTGFAVCSSDMATDLTERTIAGPSMLGLATRQAFREAACALLDEMPEGTGRLVVDLAPTRRVDSAGLGALMLVQRRAEERGQSVVLRGASEEIRFLLTLTRLSSLFEFEMDGRGRR